MEFMNRRLMEKLPVWTNAFPKQNFENDIKKRHRATIRPKYVYNAMFGYQNREGTVHWSHALTAAGQPSTQTKSPLPEWPFYHPRVDGGSSVHLPSFVIRRHIHALRGSTEKKGNGS